MIECADGQTHRGRCHDIVAAFQELRGEFGPIDYLGFASLPSALVDGSLAGRAPTAGSGRPTGAGLATDVASDWPSDLMPSTARARPAHRREGPCDAVARTIDLTESGASTTPTADVTEPDAAYPWPWAKDEPVTEDPASDSDAGRGPGSITDELSVIVSAGVDVAPVRPYVAAMVPR